MHISENVDNEPRKNLLYFCDVFDSRESLNFDFDMLRNLVLLLYIFLSPTTFIKGRQIRALKCLDSPLEIII